MLVALAMLGCKDADSDSADSPATAAFEVRITSPADGDIVEQIDATATIGVGEPLAAIASAWTPTGPRGSAVRWDCGP